MQNVVKIDDRFTVAKFAPAAERAEEAPRTRASSRW